MGREKEGEKGADGTAGIWFVWDLWDMAHGVGGKGGPLDPRGCLPAPLALQLHPVAPAWDANCTPTPPAAPEGLTSLGSPVLPWELSSVAQFGVIAAAI